VSTLFGIAAFSVALLFVTALADMESEPPITKIPPELAKRPFGAEVLTWLPLMTLFEIVSGPALASL
jgi:hypothetical protein